MTMATKPRKTRSVLELLGEPGQVDEELRRFRSTARLLSSDRARLIDRYEKQWVAVHDGKVRARAKTLRSLLAQVDRKGLPRGSLVVRYIDRTQPTMILGQA